MRFVVALLFVGSSAAFAEEAYTIRFALDSPAGQSVTYRSVQKDSGTVTFEDTETGRKEIQRPKSADTVSERTVLSVDQDGKPTAYAVRYDIARRKEGDATEVDSYEGRTLFWRKDKEGRWRVGLEGANILRPEDIDKFHSNADKPGETKALLAAMTPAKAVKIGEEWVIDLAKFVEAMDIEIDPDKSKGTVRLAKVEMEGNVVFGTFELSMDVALRRIERGNATLRLNPALNHRLEGTLRAAIDGRSTAMTRSAKETTEGDSKFGADLKKRVSGKTVAQSERTWSAETPARITAIPKNVTWISRPGEWIDYRPKNGSFTARFPGTPEAIPAVTSQVKGDEWNLAAAGGEVGYRVLRFWLLAPRPVLKEVAEKAAAKVPDTKLVEIKMGDEPAYELTHTEGRFEVRTRMVLRGRVLWHVVAGALPGKLPEEDRTRFFDSFKLPAPGEWLDFAPEDGSFKARFPDVPAAQLPAVRGDGTSIWSCTLGEKGDNFTVCRGPTTATESDGKMIAEKTSLLQKGGEVEEVKAGGTTMYQFDYRKEKLDVRHRIFLRNGQLWQVFAMDSGATPAKDRDRFFDSFALDLSAWTAFRPKDDSYRVEMPVMPREQIDQETKDWSWIAVTGGRTSVAYNVSRTSIAAKPEQVKAAAELCAQRHKGTVREVRIGDQPAYQVEYTKDSVEAFHRFHCGKDCMWQILVSGKPGNSKEEDRARFFASFRLTPPEWAEYAPKDGSFKAIVPGKPVETLGKDADAGNDRWALETNRGNVAYVVLRAPAIAGFDPKASLEAHVKTAKEAKVVEIQRGGHTYAESTYTLGALRYVHRMGAVDGTAWQALYVATPEEFKREDATKFLDSFKPGKPEK